MPIPAEIGLQSRSRCGDWMRCGRALRNLLSVETLGAPPEAAEAGREFDAGDSVVPQTEISNRQPDSFAL